MFNICFILKKAWWRGEGGGMVGKYWDSAEGSYLVNKTYFYNLQLVCEKFTKFIIWSLLPQTGSKKLRIRIYEQNNNVKLLSKKGIQKSCLQVNY